MRREVIEKAVFSAIDTVNAVLPSEVELVKNRDTLLTGDGTKLDSLGVVNVVAAVEETLAEELGVAVNLIDHVTAAPGSENPLRTVGTLIDYLDGVVARHKGF